MLECILYANGGGGVEGTVCLRSVGSVIAYAAHDVDGISTSKDYVYLFIVHDSPSLIKFCFNWTARRIVCMSGRVCRRNYDRNLITYKVGTRVCDSQKKKTNYFMI